MGSKRMKLPYANATTYEEMLANSVEVLRSLSKKTDVEQADKVLAWFVEDEYLAENPQVEQIVCAEMDHYVMYASVMKDEALADAPPDAPKVSWAIHTMPDNEVITGGPAKDIEQAKRFARIAYQAANGVVRHDS